MALARAVDVAVARRRSTSSCAIFASRSVNFKGSVSRADGEVSLRMLRASRVRNSRAHGAT
eukprot:7560917-Alexandrium_andersonii.AAC.1